MIEVVIFDLDGTIASNEWRVPLARAKRWREFHEGIPFDAPIPGICQRAIEASSVGREVAYVTNRMEYARADTRLWLAHQHLPQGSIYMRAMGDVRRGSILKREAYDRLVRAQRTPVEVYEDHPRIIPMWHELGLVVHECVDPDLPPLRMTRTEAADWVATRLP